MASLRIQADMSGMRILLRRLERKLKTPFGSGRFVIAAIKRSIRSEFVSSAWSHPGGGSIPWTNLLDGGKFSRHRKPFGGAAGELHQQWNKGTPVVTATSVELSPASGRIPDEAIAMHRGGGGTSARRRTTRVRAKNVAPSGRMKMHYLLGSRGLWISGSKLAARGVSIPSRPHATANPQLIKEIIGLTVKRLGAT